MLASQMLGRNQIPSKFTWFGIGWPSEDSVSDRDPGPGRANSYLRIFKPECLARMALIEINDARCNKHHRSPQLIDGIMICVAANGMHEAASKPVICDQSPIINNRFCSLCANALMRNSSFCHDVNCALALLPSSVPTMLWWLIKMIG